MNTHAKQLQRQVWAETRAKWIRIFHKGRAAPAALNEGEADV